MGTPHPHRDMIKAWADGEDIEYKAPGDTTWRPEEAPCFDPDYQYRVKPRTVKREGWVNIVNVETTMGAKIPLVASQIHSTKEAAKHACLSAMDVIKIEWLEDV